MITNPVKLNAAGHDLPTCLVAYNEAILRADKAYRALCWHADQPSGRTQKIRTGQWKMFEEAKAEYEAARSSLESARVDMIASLATEGARAA